MVRLSIRPKSKDNYNKKRGTHTRRSILSTGINEFEKCSLSVNNSNGKLSRKSIGIKEKIDQNKIYISKRLSNHLSNESLNQLCNQCLSLLRQNKISSKNAFEILLIDHLNDIVNVSSGESFENDYTHDTNEVENNQVIDIGINKRDLESENITFTSIDRNKGSDFGTGEDNFQKFQRAAVTLEASARIYGYRVDSTFDNAYRILSNIKSGQVLSKNSDGNVSEETDGSEVQINETCENKVEGKRTNRKVNFDLKKDNKTNGTLVPNHDLITIKNFDKCRDVAEKPSFLKLLESEIRLNRIRFGMEETGNIGSISSMMMNNLDLNQTINTDESTDNHYVSLRYNVSGYKMAGNNKNEYLNYCKSLKYPLRINKKTLELFLSPPEDNIRICPDIDKIIDSIQHISNEDIIKNQTRKLVELRGYNKFFDLKIQNSNENIGIITAGYDELYGEKKDAQNGEYDDQTITTSFQEHIESIYNDSKVNLELVMNHENSIDEADNSEFNKNSILMRTSNKIHLNIGQVLDYLTKNSKISNISCENRNKNTKKRSKKENSVIMINMDELAKDGNHEFDGVEWIRSLPKNNFVNSSNSGLKKKPKNSTAFFSGSGEKVFVNQENKTTSIFNYNQNHLFCLANISNTKINFEYIHNNNNDRDSVQNNCLLFGGNTNIPIESDINECFSYVYNSHSLHSQIQDTNFDLMKNHTEIEEFISEETNSGVSYNIEDYNNAEKKNIIIPTNNSNEFNPSYLLEKSSKTITIINEQSEFSQKFGKFSNHIDIESIKENIKKSIQLLSSNNSTLSLHNVMRTTRKLFSESSIPVSVGILFICVLHICNEENYSLDYSKDSDKSEAFYDVILKKEEH
ncbi:hypothetical protein FG386_001709 [Cryptosporidium ryanae]|uniref:uncharacterized protein n=1 Tax=Cryptosporidium ryanae TaxID=515981 RepID=UPI00351A7926|nr:hypothetical protein FG386_001709 [Cryptosporidium ryanae]